MSTQSTTLYLKCLYVQPADVPANDSSLLISITVKIESKSVIE
jgi:hypothetical protein